MFYVSVNPKYELMLRSCSARSQFLATRLEKRSIRVRLDHYKFEDIGVDRLCALESYVKTYPNQCGVVVNLGTATTIDVVGKERIHLGGWILAGIQTGLDALHEKTGLLPKLSVNSSPSDNHSSEFILGKDTISAMQHGALATVDAFIDRTLRLVQSTQNVDLRDIHIIVSGGHAELYKNRPHFKIHPHLVSDGIRIMVLGG